MHILVGGLGPWSLIHGIIKKLSKMSNETCFGILPGGGIVNGSSLR